MDAELIKKISVDFFYYWHNRSGSNTGDAFDLWWYENRQKYDQWKPIETAPKDGTTIQLMNIRNGMTDIGKWEDYSNRAFKGELDGEWNQEYGNGDMTHWKSIEEQ